MSWRTPLTPRRGSCIKRLREKAKSTRQGHTERGGGTTAGRQWGAGLEIKEGRLARKPKKDSKKTKKTTKIAQANLPRYGLHKAARGGEGCEIEPGEVRLTSDGPLDGVSRAKSLCSSISFSTSMCLLMRMPGLGEGRRPGQPTG